MAPERSLDNGTHERLVVEWQEAGGPLVLAPTRTGYGTSIIRELIPFELGGSVDLSFAPEGTRCRLEIPGEWVGRGRQKVEEGGVLGSAGSVAVGRLDAERMSAQWCCVPRVHRS